MKQKEIYLVNAKVKFADESEDIIPFYVEAESPGRAETKLERWLKEGNSNYKIIEVLSVWVKHNIWVIE